MSQPTRYDAADLRCKKCQKNVEVLGVLRSHDEGRFVMWDDYVALKAETVRKLEAAIPPVEAYIIKLEAENERLRKAGTYLCSTAEVNGISKNGDLEMHERALAFWREAAKESQL